jgi:Na+/alanine symporter
MDKLKKSLMAPVASSIALICMLMALILSATKGTKSEIGMIVLVAAILLLTVSSIIQWIKYVRGYVDFAIGQELSQIDKETKK